MRIVAGIDPGLDGGVAVLNEVDVLDTATIPTMGEGTSRVVDCGQLARWLSDRDVNEAIVELAGAHPDQGRASTFRFGVSFGQVIGMLQTLCLPYTVVSPLKWKRHYGLLNSKKRGIVVAKDDSRRRAIELFPRHAMAFEKKNSIHCAEAALLALYAHEKTATRFPGRRHSQSTICRDEYTTEGHQSQGLVPQRAAGTPRCTEADADGTATVSRRDRSSMRGPIRVARS